MLKNIFLSFLFFLLYPAILVAQSAQYSLKLAEAYEKDGRYEEAVEIYEKIFLIDSTNFKVIQGLKNGYKLLNRHDDRIRIILRQWRMDSTNTELLGELAETYYRKKDLLSARTSIQRYIASNPGSEEIYRKAGRILFELRWFEEALKIYHSGRSVLKNERLFLSETAEIYYLLGQFTAAAEDYFRYYRNNPNQWTFVRHRLLQTPEDTSVNRQIMQAIQREVKRYPDDIVLLRFQQEFSIRSKDFQSAFQTAVLIDLKEKQNGVSLLKFAEAILPHEQFRLAARVYMDFLRLYPNAPQAEMGLAAVWLALADSVKKHTLMQTDSATVLAEMVWLKMAENQYQEVLRKYPQTEWAIEARYQCGMIYMNRYLDYDRALSEFEIIVNQHKSSPWYPQALIQKVECLIRQNKLNEALRFCLQYRNQIRDPQLAEQMLFLSGELHLFLNQQDSAVAIFEITAQNAQGFFVNDALRYVLLIEKKKNAPDRFAKLILARQLHRQLRYHEAIRLLTTYGGQSDDLEDEYEWELALLYAKTGKPDEAIRRMLSLPEKMPESPLNDRALLTAADLCMQTGDPEKAASVYKQMIIRYPKSIYVQEARKKLRQIESHNR